MLEFAAIVTPLFLCCFGGIIAIYSRLARVETKLEPLWKWWNKDGSIPARAPGDD